jgi:integrase/recombinase XerD
MKSLIITSQHYNYLLQSYKEYLQVTGYAIKTTKAWPVHVQEFLHYIEKQNVQHITAIQTIHINNFIAHIKQRKNKSRDGGLSSSMINGIINAVNTFAKYINSNGKYLLDLTLHREETSTTEKHILSIAEIKQLYETTFLPYEWNSLAMGQRDRAVIALYYGCGLRRGEGVQLNISDIDLQNRLLFVRKAKGNKQRYVPIATKHLQDIGDYIKEGREWFLQYHSNNEEYHNRHNGKPLRRKGSEVLPSGEDLGGAAFLVTQHGTRFITPESRIKYLQQKAQIERPVTLHGLRHSIATHLLQSGMEIEEIAKFLGHASLASTQIYTHIVNEKSHE